MKRCIRCILPYDFPSIKFDNSGICNYCREWDKKWVNFNYDKAEKELISIFNSAKAKKRKYDCLIPYSGGRDSLYVVYLCRKKYQMNLLVVTYNNLFMSRYAQDNIFNMIDILNVDHIFVTYKPEILKQFYKAMIKGGGEFCSICAASINYVKLVYQKLFDIPLVITGTSSRVDEQSPFEVNSTHPLYVRRVLKKAGLTQKEISEFVIKRHFEWGDLEKINRKLRGSDYVEIALPDFVKWKSEEIRSVLENEVKWKTPNRSDDHIDCRFASMKTYLKNKQIPHFVFKQEKFSQLIRDKQMTRSEALLELENLIENENKKPREYEEFLDFMELNPSDIENIGKVSHLDYISKSDLIVKENFLFKLISIPWNIYKYLRGRFC